jgi:hypothetical protein
LVQTNDITEFPIFLVLCVFVRRPRGRMLVCCPHYRCLKYICDQPGIRVGFRVVLFQFLSTAGQTKASKRLHNCLARRPRLEATADRLMARFYFDFHDANGILRDDAGEELPSATIARKQALKTVGLAVKDLTYRHAEGRVVIEVRDGDGPVLRVLAVVETTSLKE